MNFEAKARLHQEKFRRDILKLSSYDIYPTMLTDEDARVGYNFCSCIPGVLESVTRRYGGFKMPLYKNLLRSEHIPFNLFAPFQHSVDDPEVLQFFQALFPLLDIHRIEAIDIEKSPEDLILGSSYTIPSKLVNHTYLDDRTSFDVLIVYRSSKLRGALGVEVKYTEKSYPYGETERVRMFSQMGDSLYHKTHEASGIYLSNTIPNLREKKLKQLWRNHLLGLKMIQNGEIRKFTSVHMFPSGNLYQEEAAREYLAKLKDECKDTFIRLTYERFIEVSRSVFKENVKWKPWIDYVEKRYIC